MNFRSLIVRTWVWIIVGAMIGALAGFVTMMLIYATRSKFVLEMDRSVSSIARGFYEPEHVGEQSFVWTQREAVLNLVGLDRRHAWSCAFRLRAPRPLQSRFPEVSIAIDGLTLLNKKTSGRYRPLKFAIPPHPGKDGAELRLLSSNTIPPGNRDRRERGVMIDRFECSPEKAALIFPPPTALQAAIMAGAAFGAAFACLGFSFLAIVGGSILLTLAQAVPLTWKYGLFTSYVYDAPWLAFWICIVLVVSVRMIEWRSGKALSYPARFAIAFSAGIAYIKLLTLLHPSKLLIDALFQAHRFELVLAGKYYFVEHMPSGVQYPYAIGLYLFAAPLAVFTNDHITLLRIITTAAEAIAGLFLYLMIVRTWEDRVMGAVAVILFHLVPISFRVIGNANLTNAFAQSMALMTIGAITVWSLGRRDLVQFILLCLITSLAFLSHVSTFALLCTTLLACGFLYRLAGGLTLRVPARSVLFATVIATVFSVVIYYGHFSDVYNRLKGVQPSFETNSVEPDAEETNTVAVGNDTQSKQTPLYLRTLNALGRTAIGLNLAIVLLAGIGVWRLRGRIHDRLVLVLIAWGIAFVIFLAVGLMPVNKPLERYAEAFINRVAYATYPACVILAACGTVWAWRSGIMFRIFSVILLIAAGGLGIRAYLNWLR